jgi:dTDP-4-amino-4,6-dideoxygalactose transaminase
MTVTPQRSIPLSDVRRQVAVVRADVEQRFGELMDTATFILRAPVARFEAEYAEYIGVKHAIGVGNGTDAVEFALRGAGVGPGDEVITVANTFIATAEAIAFAGATPVLVDADPATLNIAVDQIEAAITDRTSAIAIVHLYGRPVDMRPVLDLASRYSLRVVEDTAQAHGSTWNQRRTGSIGDVGAFSFYPTKNLGAFGDAGIIVTNDDAIAEKARFLHDHGGVVADEHRILARNSRLDSLQAAALSAQLPYLDEWNDSRRRHAAHYAERLATVRDGEFVVAPDPSGADHVHHLYVTRVPGGRRDELLARLRAAGIGAGIHYPVPIHLTPAFAFLNQPAGSFPGAEQLASEILSLPMFPLLTSDEVDYVCDVIEESAKEIA